MWSTLIQPNSNAEETTASVDGEDRTAWLEEDEELVAVAVVDGVQEEEEEEDNEEDDGEEAPDATVVEGEEEGNGKAKSIAVILEMALWSSGRFEMDCRYESSFMNAMWARRLESSMTRSVCWEKVGTRFPVPYITISSECALANTHTHTHNLSQHEI